MVRTSKVGRAGQRGVVGSALCEAGAAAAAAAAQRSMLHQQRQPSRGSGRPTCVG